LFFDENPLEADRHIRDEALYEILLRVALRAVAELFSEGESDLIDEEFTTMKHWKMGLGVLGLVMLAGCGGKEEPKTAPTTVGGGTSAPPPGIAEQIKNNPNIPADQKAKYGVK
jgi:hypothetical protein